MAWMRVREAAAYTDCHVETLRDALRAGECRGVQRVKAGTWRTRVEWVDAWIERER
ncbi:helix-turn-helix domain-containing protein [Curtobacterium sp. JUb34]|uniref:helix-turn-helix domain-containing protein n=1 Tax=Curtobacterium sp. JUb34 TaxID=2485109 RepID=UPI000F492690